MPDTANNRNHTVKTTSLLLAALLAIPSFAFAGDGVKFDIYLGDKLQHSVSLVGPNASVKFVPPGIPDSTLEFRLVAPEPVIVDMKETKNDGNDTAVAGRIKMPTPGSSFAVSELKGSKFHNPYVLVRVD